MKRTITFQINEGFQKELEDESGYIFTLKEVGEGCLTVTAIPKKDGVPFRCDFSTSLSLPQKSITLFSSVSKLNSDRDSYFSLSATFSFKSDVKLASVHPWVNQLRETHAALFGQKGLSAIAGRTVAGFAPRLVFEQMRIGFKKIHEKKSKAKDREQENRTDLFSE